MNEGFSLIMTGLSGVIGIIITYLITMRLNNQNPRAYSIGVLGFPQSGKTTLITTLFSALFARKRKNISINPRGQETINRVNDDIAKLNMGKSIGPTTDQDLFAYRANIIFKDFIFKRYYKIEIGDFPGEDSKLFEEKYGNRLHETPYFKWFIEADVFLFIIDIGEYIKPKKRKEYIELISKAMRAAWQTLLEYHTDGRKAIHRKKLILLFTKSDLLGLNKLIKNEDELITNIIKLGFSENVRKEEKIDLDEFEKNKNLVLNDFSELIKYLKGEDINFKYIFVSCFGLDKNDCKFGIMELLESILPR